MATIMFVELGLVPTSAIVANDSEAVANQLTLTFHQSSSREWPESISKSQCLE